MAGRTSNIAKRYLEMRDEFWPDVGRLLWHRSTHAGYTTIPKTMPLILKIMDEMTKGAPVSSTYLTLWCTTWDNSLAVLNKPRELAIAAGFGGQRGEGTWLSRMKRLQELSFIDLKGGKSGPLSYALIFNPHLVIRWHSKQNTPGLVEASYNALVELASEVGAKDMIGADLKELPTLTGGAKNANKQMQKSKASN